MKWRKLKKYINEMEPQTSILITDLPEYNDRNLFIFTDNALLVRNLRILEDLDYINLSSKFIHSNIRIGKRKHIPKELTKKKAHRILKGPKFFRWFIDPKYL